MGKFDFSELWSLAYIYFEIIKGKQKNLYPTKLLKDKKARQVLKNSRLQTELSEKSFTVYSKM